MSKGWSIILFVTAFFLLFALFQLDAETRRRNKVLQARLEDLDLKVATFIRGAEAEDPTKELSDIRYSQQSLFEDFRKNRKTSIELLELLIQNDEKFEKQLKQIREQVEVLEKKDLR